MQVLELFVEMLYKYSDISCFVLIQVFKFYYLKYYIRNPRYSKTSIIMYKVTQVTRSPRFASIHRSQNLRCLTYVPKHIYRNVNCKAIDMNDALTTGSYYVGKSIILFTMFYSSLNYFHYKNLREEAEKEQGEDNKKNKENEKKKK